MSALVAWVTWPSIRTERSLRAGLVCSVLYRFSDGFPYKLSKIFFDLVNEKPLARLKKIPH
jgi:hypothetical protein